MSISRHPVSATCPLQLSSLILQQLLIFLKIINSYYCHNCCAFVSNSDLVLLAVCESMSHDFSWKANTSPYGTCVGLEDLLLCSQKLIMQLLRHEKCNLLTNTPDRFLLESYKPLSISSYKITCYVFRLNFLVKSIVMQAVFVCLFSVLFWYLKTDCFATHYLGNYLFVQFVTLFSWMFLLEKKMTDQ